MLTFETLLSVSSWTVIIITGVFLVAFFYLCYIWSDMHEKRHRIEIATMVAGIYGFIVFGVGSVAAVIISLVGHYVSILFSLPH